MSKSDPTDGSPEHVRKVLARLAAEHGDDELGRQLASSPTIVRPARYDVPGQHGLADLVDQDDADGVETYRWGDARIECKGTCGKWTHHDVFIEVSGLVDIRARTMAVCRDCQHEQPGEVMHGIGDIKPRSMDRIARKAATAERARRRTRARAARESKRRNRR